MPPTEVVSDDELEAIHLASLRVLAETGIDFLHREARTMLAVAGASVDGDRVRFDADMIGEYLAHIRNSHSPGCIGLRGYPRAPVQTRRTPVTTPTENPPRPGPEPDR